MKSLNMALAYRLHKLSLYIRITSMPTFETPVHTFQTVKPAVKCKLNVHPQMSIHTHCCCHGFYLHSIRQCTLLISPIISLCFYIQLLMWSSPRSTTFLFQLLVCVSEYFSFLFTSVSQVINCQDSLKTRLSCLQHIVLFFYMLVQKSFQVQSLGQFLRTTLWRQFCCLSRLCSLFLILVICRWLMQYIHQVYTNTWTYRCTVGFKSLSPVPEKLF